MTVRLIKNFGKALRYFPTDNPSGVTNPPLGVWHFDGTTDWLTDRTANGRDFSIVTGSFEFQADSQNGMVGAYFDSGQDHELILPDEEALRIAKDELGGGDASLTLEAIVRQTTASGIILGCDAGGESLTTNYLWQFGPSWNDAGTYKYYSFVERGGGSNVDVFSNGPISTDELIYLAMTISADGLTWKWYRNGALVGTAVIVNSAQKNSAGGNVQRVRVGRQESDANDFKGWIYSLRITNETFDASDVADAWDELAATGDDNAFVRAQGDDKAALLDEAELVSAGGPPLHSGPAGTGGGQLVPGPATQQPGSIGPFDTSKILDQVEYESSEGTPNLGLENFTQVVPKAALLDSVQHYDGYTATYSATTTDSEGHPHFVGDRAYLAFMYDAYGEAALWTDPEDPSFTGYGKDGYYYISGVNQSTLAPWAAESPSADRSSRPNFPDKVLIVASQVGSVTKEIVIFDMDSFPATLDVWMRFKPRDGNNAFWMIGNENRPVKSLSMAGGVLVVGTEAGGAAGGIHIINFMATGQDCGHLIRSDNHYKVKSGYTIANRNTQTDWTTTGVSPSLRIAPESAYSVSVTSDGTDTWIACAGEDQGPDVCRVDVSPQAMHSATGETGDANVGDTRKVLFDGDGWLWFTNGTRLVRNIFDYLEGLIHIPETSVTNSRRRGNNPIWIELPDQPTAITGTANYIFAITDRGIYRIHRGSFEYELAYSIIGGGGTHEHLVSEFPEVAGADVMTLSFSSYVSVATGLVGEGTLIRMLDEYVVDTKEYPELFDPGCYFHMMWTDRV